MSTLVLNRDSISVKLESDHLLLHEHANGGSFVRVPLVDIERVIVVGEPAITFPVMVKLLDMKIPCSFLTKGGRWRGVMDGDEGFHATRRINQYAKLADPDFSVVVSRQIVMSKISNCRRTVQRFAAERKMQLSDNPEMKMLSSLLSGVALEKTVAGVRGIEGIAANIYFKMLSLFFPDDVPFECRTRRPPRNAANALMSFVYTLLANSFVSAVRAHGLDAAGGFLHRANNRSPALAFDLMEPFRPSLADRLVLNLLNHRKIRKEEHFSGNPEEGVMLTAEGRKIVFCAFDEVMARKCKTVHGMFSYRQIIDKEVCRFLSILEADGEVSFFKAA